MISQATRLQDAQDLTTKTPDQILTKANRQKTSNTDH